MEQFREIILSLGGLDNQIHYEIHIAFDYIMACSIKTNRLLNKMFMVPKVGSEIRQNRCLPGGLNFSLIYIYIVNIYIGKFIQF